MARCVLAIDQGTTSSRALLFDADANVLASAQEPLPSSFPRPGWVNQDAEQIWTITLAVARRALAESGIAAADIAGIGISNQRETTILWERATGRPVAPAIVWQSRQSAGLVDAIAGRGLEGLYQATTGLVPDAYFSATKIAWMLEGDLELRRRAEAGEICFGTVDSWLMWHLSEGREHVTDAANASRTMLFDIHKGAWSPELLTDLAVPAAMMPAVIDNSGVAFETGAELFGGARIPVAGAAGDQQAALFGQACFAPGEAKNTYGTGSFLLMNTGPEAVVSRNRLLTTIAWRLAGATTYALEGAIFVTGSAVQWLRDGLGIIAHANEVGPLAASVPDADGVVFVPALTGLGAPHWDAGARGMLIGITRGTTRAHIARATLEAIAFQTRDVLDAMTADSGVTLAELKVDGGAANNDLLMQIQADVLGVPVVRPAMTETSVLGAAYLAGVATGVWPDQAAVRDRWREDARWMPRWTDTERDRRYATWQDAVTRSRAWAPAG